MPTNPITGVSKVGSDRQAAFRKVVVDRPESLPGGLIIRGADSRDPLNTGDLDILRAGMVLGRNSSTNKFAPTIIGTLTQAYDDSSANTTMNVSSATATEIDRRIGASGTFTIIGPPSAGGTVASETITYSSINTSTGAITITAASADYISGSFIADTDGTEDPLVIVGDGYGVKVTDVDDANQDVELPGSSGMWPLIGGVIDASQLINWPSDSALQTWLQGKLNGTDGTVAGHGRFVFDFRFTGS